MGKRIFSRLVFGVGIAALALAGLEAEAHVGKKLCTGFAPPNTMNIPVGASFAGGITKAQFDSVLDRITTQYTAEVASKGAKLRVNRLWSDGTVNASAEQDKNGNWIINMYGGLARHKVVTEDGFALVACHEMGHHLGGAPKYGGAEDDWASNEGQSDYYGTLKCFRRYTENDDNEKILAGMQLDPLAVSTCEATHTNPADQRICIRGTMAGIVLAELLRDLGGEPKISLGTPDKSEVKKTQDGHPDAQCRLDTYFGGALCTELVIREVSNSDYKPGTCHDSTVHAKGLRPRCWFKP